MIRRREFLKRMLIGTLAIKATASEVWAMPGGPVGIPGMVSKKIDLGAGKMFHIVADCEFDVSPTLGERVDFYIATSPEESLENNMFLGSLIVDEQAGPTRIGRHIGSFVVPSDKFSFLIVDNQSGAELRDWDFGAIELEQQITQEHGWTYNVPG